MLLRQNPNIFMSYDTGSCLILSRNVVHSCGYVFTLMNASQKWRPREMFLTSSSWGELLITGGLERIDARPPTRERSIGLRM